MTTPIEPVQQDRTGFEIAVIGMAGIFPGARNIDEFWENLRNGKESVSYLTDEELTESGFDPENLEENYVRCKGGFLEDKELFDASFFGYTPNEATVMNPQLRKLHECSWEALEHAGYNPHSYRGSIGFYAGATGTYYWESLSLLSGKTNELGNVASRILINNDYLATKISHKLNLMGPSATIGTACSTSLVAIHMACRSILSGECDMALAGGVAVSPERSLGYYWTEGMIISPDGHCRAFDEKAKGTIGGNGCGIVVLKALEEAEADGDYIHAVIKSSVTNNDGDRRIGFTAPSIQGQVEAIRAAHRMAEIEPESISYIEAHGTATEIGDPVEIEALKLAFDTEKKGICGIGSVKTNVGHLDHAAGVTGFIKTVLALENKRIPPSLHYEIPNPRIDFIDSPFYVVTRSTPWRNEGGPLRAGVSAFGLGGTNAHVVLEEAPTLRPAISFPPSERENLLVLSARCSDTLEAMTENLVQYLEQHPDVKLSNVAFTLQAGRKAFSHRRVLICSGQAEAIDQLTQKENGKVRTYINKVEKRSVAFIFAEQGNMPERAGHQLYQEEPGFWGPYDQCAKAIQDITGQDIKEQKHQAEPTGKGKKENSVLGGFALQYALARMLLGLGLEPFAMIGQDNGDIIASCVAEGISLEQGIRRIWNRNGRDSEPADSQEKNGTPAILTGKINTLLQEPEPLFISFFPEEELENTLNTIRKEQQEKTFCHVTLLETSEHEENRTKGVIESLSKLWLYGVNINWTKYGSGKKKKRLPLPTYPFNRQNYWIEGNPFQLGAQLMRGRDPLAKRPNVADWFYIPTWKRSVTPMAPGKIGETELCWLVFQDKTGLGEQLVKQLQEKNQDVVVVKEGEGFQKVTDQEYRIHPGRVGDYDALFREFHQKGKSPHRILHLWLVTESLDTEKNKWDLDLVDPGLDLGFYSLTYLAQAIGKKNISNNIQIAAVTNDLHQVSGEENLKPEKSTLLGAVKVIPLEYTNISCFNMDVKTPEKGHWDGETILHQLLKEFEQETSKEVVAYRGNYRWTQIFEPQKLEKPEAMGLRLRKEGVYLVTGGLGGIGYVLAEHLAKTLQAKLILTGRSEMPPREQWEEWVTNHEPEEPNCQKITKIKALEELGAEVELVIADVADADKMQPVRDIIEKRFGTLHGIIHSAGLPDGGVIPLRTRENTDSILLPKVKGTMILDNLLGDYELDFFACCSSITSVLVPIGQLGYCAANNFLDFFAHYNTQKRGTYTVSVDWDVWKEVGMGVEAARLLKENEGIADSEFMLKKGICNPEGVDAFFSILEYDYPHVVVSTRNLPVRIKNFVASGVAEPEEISNVEKFKGKTYPRPELSTEYIPPNTEFEKTFADILTNFFGYEKVGINDNFFEFGVTSLTIIRINGLLREKLEKTIPIVIMFEYPTIQSLGNYLEQEDRGESVEEAAAETEDLGKAEDLLYDSIDLLSQSMEEED
jgi:acyl transferase domain-containing protein/acyl carrier protein